MGSSTPQREENILDEVRIGHSAKVILFNDNVHTFDEVIHQIIKATGCSYEHAEMLTSEVHFRGKACVFDGEFSKCLQVTSVLEEINLLTQIEV